MEDQPLLTVPEVALRLHVSQKSVWRALGAGRLARVKVGARTLVTPESVTAFIAGGGTPSLQVPGEG